MNSKTLLITAALNLLAAGLFATNNIPPAKKDLTRDPSGYCISLAPATPAEATFEDEVPVTDYHNLMPTPPRQATFEDEPVDSILLKVLAPVAPSEADFSDSQL